MLSKECLEVFKPECELRRLSPRMVKGYYNSIIRCLRAFVFSSKLR